MSNLKLSSFFADIYDRFAHLVSYLSAEQTGTESKYRLQII